MDNYRTFLGSLFMTCSILILLKSYWCQLSSLSLQSSIYAGNQISVFKETSFLQKLDRISKEIKPICSCSSSWEPISNFCEIKGDIRVQGNFSTISIVSSQMGTQARNISYVVKPYIRKDNPVAMDLVKNWSVTSVTSQTEFLHCDLVQSVPAILFSLGGFSGNHFHDFSDLVIPLYTTSKQFNGQVQFLVTDNKPWWITKFQAILTNLSRYDNVDLDTEAKTHCYPRIIVGLKFHKELGIDQSKSQDQLSMNDFRQFLRSTYSLKRRNTIRHHKKPRLVIISRRKSRSFTNINEITRMAGSLGYDVVTAEPNMTGLSSVAQTVNSCDVLMGIHGAGLTNMVFLPDKAIVIQIVPLGSIDGLCREYFGKPARDMNLRYLEYKIKAKESSLIKKYQLDHAIIKDPLLVHKQGWDVVKSTYLDKQNVKLDVRRFRTTLLKALELLHH